MTKKNVKKTKKKDTLNNWSERRNLIVFAGISVLILVITAFIVTNYGVIRDVFAGMGYRPTAEMEEIRDKLSLTGTGVRIFNASLPELKEKAEFNQECREIENESAILGCYRDEKIYIYNIVDDELPGIRELTAAHELLHAVYKRMGDSDKKKWNEILMPIYEENQDVLGSEIDEYPDEQKNEEIYVRVGTEIKDLPDELEKHYGEIFENQDLIVDFYDGYIAVFRKIQKKMSELLTEVEKLEETINSKTADYTARVEKLNEDVKKFNECAGTLNCFSSTAVFNSERVGLLGEQSALNTLYNEINSLVEKYNNLVNEYNENALHGQKLNMKINSSEKLDESQ
ncbi:hypothetical protein IJ076_00660 [Candidatus Saccharibacteria bacterium]|nr:hypothetical protein [Candidatus Saccharibacteria bacterium]